MESDTILRSTVRSFFKSIAIIFGIAVACLPLLILFISLGSDHHLSDKTLFHILPDEFGNRTILSPRSPAILEIKINGIIGTELLSSQTIENVLADSRLGILKNNRVKAILLNINSPGGGVFDSDTIYRMLKNYKQTYNLPVFAYVEGMCASGGYYIACAADKIFSSPVGIVGSVGVVTGPFINVYDTLTKWGIKTKTLTQGQGKDAMNPLRPWKENEGENLEKVMSYLYQRFVDIVVLSREQITKNELINDYGAHIFDAKQAEQIGMIDQGDMDHRDALRSLAKQANINEPYQVVELVPKKGWFNDIFNSKSGILNRILFGSSPYAFQDQFAYLFQSSP